MAGSQSCLRCYHRSGCFLSRIKQAHTREFVQDSEGRLEGFAFPSWTQADRGRDLIHYCLKLPRRYTYVRFRDELQKEGFWSAIGRIPPDREAQETMRSLWERGGKWSLEKQGEVLADLHGGQGLLGCQ